MCLVNEILLASLRIDEENKYNMVYSSEGWAQFEVASPNVQMAMFQNYGCDSYSIALQINSHPANAAKPKWTKVKFMAHYCEIEDVVNICCHMMNKTIIKRNTLLPEEEVDWVRWVEESLKRLKKLDESLNYIQNGMVADKMLVKFCDAQTKLDVSTILSSIHKEAPMQMACLKVVATAPDNPSINIEYNHYIPSKDWVEYPLLAPLKHNLLPPSTVSQTENVLEILKETHPMFQAMYLEEKMSHNSASLKRNKL